MRIKSWSKISNEFFYKLSGKSSQTMPHQSIPGMIGGALDHPSMGISGLPPGGQMMTASSLATSQQTSQPTSDNKNKQNKKVYVR